jgi:ribose transport system ATP-binding protein
MNEAYTAPIVDIRNMSNHFGHVRVLDSVDLAIRQGEVHCLLGHNGSGKSTLIKILSGYYAPDPESKLSVEGQVVKLPLKPDLQRALGFGFVHQDLGLISSLSVVDNLRLGLQAGGNRWFLSPSAERRRAEATMALYNVRIDVMAAVRTLRPWDRAAVAIARAMHELRSAEVSVGRGLLVLDEVTAFLPRERKEALYLMVREIAANGSGILFVSHDIDEVLRVADRVTVLRDGHVAGTVNAAGTTVRELVMMIVGHEADFETHIASNQAAATNSLVAVTDLSGGSLTAVSLEIAQGGILGVTGILGSGFEELPYLLFGSMAASGGLLRIAGVSHDLRKFSPAGAIRAGIRLVPADRLTDGLVGQLPVVDNVTLPVLREFVRGSVGLRRRRMVAATRRLMTRFRVTPSDPSLAVQDLSGGNQQKALLAKWLQGDPRLLLLHEPTQGVDVGARQEIFRLIREAAASGAAILVASEDHAQLEAVCDRVSILKAGTIVRTLEGTEVRKARITAETYGGGT